MWRSLLELLKLRTSEWSSAWRRASKAISFVFQHQRDELLEYGNYIKAKFSANITTSHQQIILCGIAVRNKVGAGHRVLLTDTHCFSCLYSAIIMPDRIEGCDHQTFGKKSDDLSSNYGKPEICYKFNNGMCKSTDTNCKYWRVCKGCKKFGHGKKDCPAESHWDTVYGLQLKYYITCGRNCLLCCPPLLSGQSMLLPSLILPLQRCLTPSSIRLLLITPISFRLSLLSRLIFLRNYSATIQTENLSNPSV